ncbi:substrate-binding periplasmic protein [Balneatrix alpica]|uniref:Substrate-binding periplasmic protein n=1 Tax=Balneatrix alpica TaxID=75684 RepID=A0ABV5ZAL9_9GAMM
MGRCCPWLLCCLALSPPALAGPDNLKQTVNICDDAAEWPPYVYYQRTLGVKHTNQITGATTELLKQIFTNLGLNYRLQLLPWKRCLYEVEHFDRNGNFEVVSNASTNQKRLSYSYASLPLYRVHQGAFYSTRRFPQPPDIKQPSDFNTYRLCGIHGYNYDMFYQTGIKPEWDYSPGSNHQALLMLSARHCDFFMGTLEPVLGGEPAGLYQISEDIRYLAVEGMPVTDFHLLVSKASPRGEWLIEQINQQLQRLQRSGLVDAIYHRYLPLHGSGLHPHPPGSAIVSKRLSLPP